MPHLHSVYDTDAHFSIDPITRKIRNESSGKTGVIQYDHNSERFTFEIPRHFDGHDMSLCNVIQVHYINIDSTTRATNADVYEVDDMQISPDSDDVVILSWLISQNATQLVGSLNFLIRFACVSDDGTVDYVWNTAVCSGISVSTGMFNSEIIVEEYADILAQWEIRIQALEYGGGGAVPIDNTLTVAGQAADAKAVGDAISSLSEEIANCIKSPASVEVGQTIVVKAVDEDGKPTEWEPANLPEKVQSDWIQNNSDAADYVKNRTHYEEVVYLEYVLDSDGVSFYGLEMPDVGETKTVKINGVESVETVKSAESSIFKATIKYIGNTDIDSMLMGGFGWCAALIGNVYVGVANPDTTIGFNKTIVHKLDSKFLNFEGLSRTFDYYFSEYSLYRVMYDDEGNECILYTSDKLILPEVNQKLLGGLGEIGLSEVASVGIFSAFVTSYEIQYDGSICCRDYVIGTNTDEMKELAANYGFTHTTNPTA